MSDSQNRTRTAPIAPIEVFPLRAHIHSVNTLTGSIGSIRRSEQLGLFDAAVPKRIRRSRAKGWRKPDGSVIVDRTSRYGNPYKVGRDAASSAEAVEMYRRYLDTRPDLIEQIKANLRGRDLVCFCDLTAPCHADALLALANEFQQFDTTTQGDNR
jgi:hypothetical protein